MLYFLSYIKYKMYIYITLLILDTMVVKVWDIAPWYASGGVSSMGHQGPRGTRLECICRAKRNALAKDLTRMLCDALEDESRVGPIWSDNDDEEGAGGVGGWGEGQVILWLVTILIWSYEYFIDVYCNRFIFDDFKHIICAHNFLLSSTSPLLYVSP